MPEGLRPSVAFAATGVANLASIMAAFRRAGAEPRLAAGPEELAAAPFAVLPGVGSFGSAMAALTAAGMDEAIRDRITRRLPTMGVCAGMQLFFEGSAESPGVAGMGIVPGVFKRFPSDIPVPQLGWNRVAPAAAHGDAPDFLISAERSSAGDARSASPRLVRRGWAYFANSYRLSELPEGFAACMAEYGESFVASLERRGADGTGTDLLLCQFHPELSGPWGQGLIRSWLESSTARKGGAA
jgi:imidazoleglycerol phosphate synthase glutamine amidotransferase subunit HisH